jgi:hypothetical protein
LTHACAPSVAFEAVVDTFQSTLIVTPVIEALVGIVESKPKVPRLTVLLLFFWRPLVAYALSDA